MIVGFDTAIDSGAKALAERAGVKIETFNIIYKLAEWLEEFMKEKTPKMKVEELRGRAKVLRFFSRTKDKQVIGCRVESGSIYLNDEIKIGSVYLRLLLEQGDLTAEKDAATGMSMRILVVRMGKICCCRCV